MEIGLLALDMTAHPFPFFAAAARPRRATLSDMLTLASAIYVGVGDCADDEGLVALGWAFRNRAARGAAHRAQTGRSHSEYGDGSLGLACREMRDDAPALSFADPLYCRAIAVACLVWSGDLSDPTGGATRFHRHDADLPPWAVRKAPVALIGPNFFYRDD